MHSFTTWNNEVLEWPFDNVEPREVQLRAVSFAFGKPGFAYFMRQRLGKTWASYAEYVLLRKQGKVDWCIIICPNSLKGVWAEAIEHVDPYTPIRKYESSQKSKMEYYLKNNKKGGVIILNYESVKAYCDTFAEDILGTNDHVYKRCYIVADESTSIKDGTNKTSKACHKLADKCAYKRVLTGRPTANTNVDIWGQLRFINCTNRSYMQHKYTFCVMGGFQGRSVVKNINVPLLQSEIAPISYIAEDKYVVGFKKIYEPMRKVNLTGKLGDLYKKMQTELLFEVSDDVNITAPIMLVKYLRLQQISSGIAGDLDGVQHNLIEPRNNPRIKTILEILESEIGHKVIIVCRFSLSMKNLYEVITGMGKKVSVLSGRMKDDQITSMKKKFNEDDTDVMIAQTQVLRFGHTLAGNKNNPCDSIIFYENDFSLINRAQCESRPEEMGRAIPISLYDVYASKMDRYILEKLLSKEEASLALMNYSREYGMRPEGLESDKEVDKEFAM